MENDLIKLYNTMLLVETKGESTKTMALCLNFVQQLIDKEKNKQSAQPTPEEGD